MSSYKWIATATITMLATGVAAADIVPFADAEVIIPEGDWQIHAEDDMMQLAPEQGGGLLELYSLAKTPAADKVALTKLLTASKKDLDEVVLTRITAKYEQHGLKGIAFRGTAQTHGKPVAFTAVGLDGLKGHAVLAIAYTRPDDGDSKVIGVVPTLRRATKH